eukprot:TRINITY_DN3760_c0_g2_i1.p1 TRINITY_DN3760_c0_g2~~TRINITY_DN3760_c0_g2_i1.p1  ORF type:complete len:615 (-),score=119.22 TRINITY_DN3760_c0_g2_i1:102-1763(-)
MAKRIAKLYNRQELSDVIFEVGSRRVESQSTLYTTMARTKAKARAGPAEAAPAAEKTAKKSKSKTSDEVGIFSEYQEMAKRIAKLYNRQELSDVIFEVGSSNRRFYAHACIVTPCSDLFAELVRSAPVVDNVATVKLSDADAEEFEFVLRFIYSGEAVIPVEKAIDLFHLGEKFKVEGLKLVTQKAMTDAINKDQVVSLLRSCQERGMTHMVDECVKFIAKRPSAVFRSNDMVRLDFDTMKMLLSDDKLALNDEVDAFKAVVKWGQAPSSDRSREVKELSQLIRYGLIEPDMLRQHVVPTELVPVEVLIDSLLANQGLIEPSDSKPYLKPRGGVAEGSSVWNKSMTNSGLTIKKAGRLLVGAGTSSQWITSCVTGVMTTGTWYCEIEAVSATSSYCQFGVATLACAKQQVKAAGGCYTQQGGWMLHPYNNQCYHASAAHAISTTGMPGSGFRPRKTSDSNILGCLVSFDRGCVEFFKGGQSLGTAYGPKSLGRGKYVFAVDVYNNNNITIKCCRRVDPEEMKHYTRWTQGKGKAGDDDESESEVSDAASEADE